MSGVENKFGEAVSVAAAARWWPKNRFRVLNLYIGYPLIQTPNRGGYPTTPIKPKTYYNIDIYRELQNRFHKVATMFPP